MGDSDATRSSIEALLRPSSIAIAGASTDPGKLGSMPLAFLKKHGYAGAIYPVHPREQEIGGLTCYRSLAQIDGNVDLLVVAVAAARITELLDQCRPGQVKSALILSSGFAETGDEGARLQRDIGALAASKGIRFIGPNSVGLANLHDRVIPSISQVFDQTGLVAGPVGFVSQSGAVGTAITALAHAEQLGIGYFLSTGNEGDLDIGDFCDFFADDPRVRVIAGYIESIRDGAKFRAAAIKAARAGKPVVMIKVGGSDAGSKAVQSHTGALAGSEEVYRAAFDELGIVRVRSIEELIDVLKVMSAPARARNTRRAPRVAILSHSGGAGVLMADTSIDEGLDVAPPSAALTAALQKRLPPYASLQNPIDMTANVIFDPALMAGSVRDVLESGEYDAAMLCVNLIWRQGPGLADALASLADAHALFGVAWIAGKPEPLAHLNKSGVPVYPDPVRCARAIAARLRWEARRDEVAASAIVDPGAASRSAPESLDRFATQQALLDEFGIATAPCALVANADEARRAAGRLGYPVAIKLVAPGLAHKSEIGGVQLDIASDTAVDQAIAALTAIPVANREGFLIQKMIGGGLEVFVGMKRDAVFGPVVVVGLGGIYVEIIRETVLRLAPFDQAAAERLVRGAKFFPLLDGARGRPKLDVAALARIVSGVSRLAIAIPSLRSLDLNPVIVGAAGACVVDFKFEVDGRFAVTKPIRRVLIANRGEIAVRVNRSCRDLGIETVQVYSEADRDSLAVKLADRAVCIGGPRSSESYLNPQTLVRAAIAFKADAIHPGYGFLSERPAFAALCAAEGLTWIGPGADVIRLMGDKAAARAAAKKAGLRTTPGSVGVVRDSDEAARVAEALGFPLLLKASAGGGGRGMRLVADGGAMKEAFAQAQKEALAAFGDGSLYVEKFLTRVRHIEVQVLGDRETVLHLGERDCSTQRRNQKLVEESPAAGLAPALRDEICEAAARLAQEVGYTSAGTVEFIVDEAAGEYYFMEMNTRIQVEHPVTEMVTGTDLVACQIRIAAGEGVGFAQRDVTYCGHAIECRVNAEDAADNFRPSPGVVTGYHAPGGPGVRVDSHLFHGYTVPPYYDSLIAKLITWGATREEAISRMQRALAEMRVDGVTTTIPFHQRLLRDRAFVDARMHTRYVEQEFLRANAS